MNRYFIANLREDLSGVWFGYQQNSTIGKDMVRFCYL